MNSLEILKKYWNHNSFRAPQDQIIKAVLEKQDVIALLPTGGGKSICFQVPAMQLEGICIVVSPLIALMQDQVANLNERGIKALSLNSGVSQDDLIRIFDNLQFGEYKFLYLSPERLQSSFIQEKIKQLNVSLIAIDEAHCISEWGHDFRPSYRHINVLKEIKPEVNFIALTASATKEVLTDISESLNFNNPHIFKKSFYRDNLAYQIFSVEDKLHRLLQICIKTKSPSIVYVSSRKKTKEIATFLNANGFSAGYYHGGLSALEKHEAFENWMLEKTPIIVATNAFGMGIDKDNVKVVVHIDLPTSIENYIQEAGRAGRNGEKAFSAVLQNKNDIRLFQEKIETTYPTLIEIKEIYKNLHLNFHIAHGELNEKSYEFNFSLFSDKYNYTANKLDTALKILCNNNVIELSDNYTKKSTLQILATSKEILNYIKSKKNLSELINTILRSYGGLFEQQTKINEYWLAKKNKTSVTTIVTLLEQLNTEGLIDYQKSKNKSDIYFLVPREDNIAINRIAKNSTHYINQKKKKSEEFIRFIENDNICRSIQVLHYFNEYNVSKCGICDVCLSERNTTKDISMQIIEFLKLKNTQTSKEICNYLSADDATIVLNLQHLLDKDKIAINNYNQYYLK